MTILELPPGLPILTYQTIDLAANAQAISLDGLPLGAAATAGFTSEMLWDNDTQILWDSGSVIEWDEATITPGVIELRS